MARKSKESYIKKAKADAKRKNKLNKLEKRMEKRNVESKGDLSEMLAYVDENGNITTEKPEETDQETSDENS
ncbi:MAG: cold-shock protein [Bacteroidetes bacterium]|nr:cold-shock protein [Bacteroidota bacterium]